jgi:hypothetical protein
LGFLAAIFPRTIPALCEHDPEKPALHSMRGGNRFSEKIMLNQGHLHVIRR